jgi:hypothetical protein
MGFLPYYLLPITLEKAGGSLFLYSRSLID